MIGRSGERGSGISVLAARHDDDDDDLPTVKWLQVLIFNTDVSIQYNSFICTQMVVSILFITNGTKYSIYHKWY